METIVKEVGDCQIGKNKQKIFSYFIGLVIGQKIKFSTAKKARSRIYEYTGNYNFEPEDVLSLSNDKWVGIGIENIQKETILLVSKHFLKKYQNITKDDILELKKIKGIGEWTVSTLLIEYGLDYNLFPTNDKHVNKQLKKYYNVDEKDISQFVQKYSPYKSVAFWYLWKISLN